MDSFNLSDYKDIFIKSTNDDLKRIKKLLKENPDDIGVIHRLFHTIKGRSFFIGYHDLGMICLNAEKKLDQKVKMGAKLSETEKKDLLAYVEQINAMVPKL